MKVHFFLSLLSALIFGDFLVEGADIGSRTPRTLGGKGKGKSKKSDYSLVEEALAYAVKAYHEAEIAKGVAYALTSVVYGIDKEVDVLEGIVIKANITVEDYSRALLGEGLLLAASSKATAISANATIVVAQDMLAWATASIDTAIAKVEKQLEYEIKKEDLLAALKAALALLGDAQHALVAATEATDGAQAAIVGLYDAICGVYDAITAALAAESKVYAHALLDALDAAGAAVAATDPAVVAIGKAEKTTNAAYAAIGLAVGGLTAFLDLVAKYYYR